MNTDVITRPIRLLALVSLFADLASEMLYPIMPVYLQSVGFSVALIGLLEGVAEVTAGLSKGYFGRLSDQWGRRLPFVRLGYALSALSKPLLALFALPGWVFATRTLDRLGKGLRTGARDALLADQSLPQTRGQVFGFHRSMDTLGGVLGPVAALVYLYYFPGHYVPLFLLAFGPGLLSVAITFLLKDRVIQPTPAPPAPATQQPASVFGFLRYWRASPPEYRRVVGGLLAFALFNSSDVFLLLKIKEAGLSDTSVVGLYVFYNLVYAVAAYPIGRLADRLGLKPTLLVGLGLFALVYEGMVVAHQLPVFVVLLSLYGVYAAATEGIAKAWISTISGSSHTATAIGTYAGLGSICALVANALAGWLWYAFGAPVTFAVTGAATLGVIVYLVAIEGQHQHTLPLQRSLIIVDPNPDSDDSDPVPVGYAGTDRRSNVLLTRSAFMAMLLLIACLGAWTVYMSYVAVSTTFGPGRASTASTAGNGNERRSASPTVSRHTGPQRPAGADPADGSSVAARNAIRAGYSAPGRFSGSGSPVAVGPTGPAGPPNVAIKANSAIPGERPAERPAPTAKPNRPQRSQVHLYTLTALYTHLYTKPNKRSSRRAFINIWKKVIVTALAERNGFYYVVYTNKKGQTVNGWLPKKALRRVKLATPLYSS